MVHVRFYDRTLVTVESRDFTVVVETPVPSLPFHYQGALESTFKFPGDHRLSPKHIIVA